MLIIGLTGSIAMGKSTAAERFRDNGIAVFDADAEVHRLYAGDAVPLVEQAFPGVTDGQSVDRKKLMVALTSTDNGFARLEAIIHPLVREAERRFLKQEHDKGAKFAVLEIPLLFETGADKLVDKTIVVSAGQEAQRVRALERPDMTPEKFNKIVARQMPDGEKRTRADFVVDTSGSIETSAKQIESIIESLNGAAGKAYQRHWA